MPMKYNKVAISVITITLAVACVFDYSQRNSSASKEVKSSKIQKDNLTPHSMPYYSSSSKVSTSSSSIETSQTTSSSTDTEEDTLASSSSSSIEEQSVSTQTSQSQNNTATVQSSSTTDPSSVAESSSQQPIQTRTDGMNWNNHHYDISTFDGSNTQIPRWTSYVYRWTMLQNFYAIEGNSDAGLRTKELIVGSEIILNNKTYHVTSIDPSMQRCNANTSAYVFEKAKQHAFVLQTCNDVAGNNIRLYWVD